MMFGSGLEPSKAELFEVAAQMHLAWAVIPPH